MTKQEYEAAIAELRERHEAFVRKVWEVVGTPTALPDCDLLDKVLVLCSAELGKEGK